MANPSDAPKSPSELEVQQHITAHYRDQIRQNPALGRQISQEEWALLSPVERDTILAAEQFAGQKDSSERERSTEAQMIARRVLRDVGVTLDLEAQFAEQATPHPYDDKPVTPA